MSAAPATARAVPLESKTTAGLLGDPRKVRPSFDSMEL